MNRLAADSATGLTDMKIDDAVTEVPPEFRSRYYAVVADLRMDDQNILERAIRDARDLSSRMKRMQGQYGANTRPYYGDSAPVLCTRVGDHLEGLADAAEARLRERRGEPVSDPGGREGYVSRLNNAWRQ